MIKSNGKVIIEPIKKKKEKNLVHLKEYIFLEEMTRPNTRKEKSLVSF